VKIPVTEQIVTSGTNNHVTLNSKLLKSPYFPILTFSLEFRRLSWPEPHPLMHRSNCHVIGWLD